MKKVYTACQGYGCHEHCVITTYTNEEGVIERTERLVPPEGLQEHFPGCLEERCGICHKGIISGKLPYIKERVLYPGKRIGPRGTNNFERISWDQALTEICDKLAEIREKYGPRSVLFNHFPCGLPGAPISFPLQFRFQVALGCSNMELEGVDESIIKVPSMYWGDAMVVNEQDTTHVLDADYILMWGGNPLGYSRSSYTTRNLMRKRDEGVKMVDIGVLFDSTAALVDNFVQVKPATDGALALSMVHEIIANGWQNDEFLLNETVAPFLVRQDTGKFLRASDIDENGGDQYVAVAQADGMLYYVTPDNHATTWAKLEADVVYNDIRCKTAFTCLKEHVAEFTPEWQEEHTGVAPEVVREIVDEYVHHENALLYMLAGLRYKNSVDAARAILLLPTLTGKFFNDASGILCEPNLDSWPVQLNDFGMFMGGIEKPEGSYAPMHEILEAPMHPERQQYKALINTWQNPVHNWPPRSMWENDFFPQLELVVAIEYRYTETTAFADYVLPDTMSFEREEIITRGSCLILAEPAIEPRGEARECGMVLCEIATRLGYGEYFDKTHDEWLEMKLESTDPIVAFAEPPITLERLRDEKIIALDTPQKRFNMFKELPLLTPSTRHEFYVEELAGIEGGPLMNYTKALIQEEERSEKYPLHLFVGRSRFFMQGQFREIPELRTLSGNGPRLGMYKGDALARGINEGDMVEVFNEKGVVKVPVHFTKFTQPGQVHLWYAYGADDYKDSAPATALGTHISCREAIDERSMAWGKVLRRRNNESGLPENLTANPGMYANETIWDALCDVRRAE